MPRWHPACPPDTAGGADCHGDRGDGSMADMEQAVWLGSVPIKIVIITTQNTVDTYTVTDDTPSQICQDIYLNFVQDQNLKCYHNGKLSELICL